MKSAPDNASCLSAPQSVRGRRDDGAQRLAGAPPPDIRGYDMEERS